MFAAGGVPGQKIQVTPNGAKSWRLRFKLDGRRRDAGLGSYPALGLETTRDAATDARTLIPLGIDLTVKAAPVAAVPAFAEAIEGSATANPDQFGSAAPL